MRRRRALEIAFGALGALVALVAALGTWQVLAARDSQRSQIYRGELTTAHFAGKAVLNAVSTQEQLLVNLTAQPGSADLVTQANPVAIQPVLSELVLLYPQFSSISIANSAGKVFAQDPSWQTTTSVTSSRSEAFEGAVKSGRTYATGAFVQPNGNLAVTLGSPVKETSGQFVGVVMATVPVSTLSAAIGGTNLGNGGTLVIVDQHGHPVTGPASVKEHTSSSPSLPEFRSNGVVSKALEGRSGTSTASVPGFSGNRLVAFVPIKTLGWALIVANPLSTLDKPVASLTSRLLGIGVAVLLFAVATAIGLWLLLRQLSRQRDEVTAIFSSVGEGVATLDAEGRVERVNPALEQLAGRSASQLEGRLWSEAFVVQDDRGGEVDWKQSVASEAITKRDVVASRGFSLSLLTANGRRVPVAVTASPLFLDGSTPSGVVMVFRDISREREVDQLKSSLVSTVSHELRTPLTLIQGFSELLLTRSNLDSVQSQAALTQIHASSQRLGRLIDDLLSVSRIESGRLSTEVEPLELSPIVDEVIASFSVDASHTFVANIDPSTGAILADRDKVLQVLTNLVSNAVKYSPMGTEVRVAARPAGGHAEVAVSDQGIGMSNAEAAQIFEKFSRSDRPEVRKVGGTGLGLYITKNLVELQGGALSMESESGRGSTFTFTVPLAKRQQGDPHLAPVGARHVDATAAAGIGPAGSQRDQR